MYNADYESPIKVESCHKFLVTDKVLVNCGLESPYSGAVGLNIGNQVNGNITQNGVVSNNLVVNYGGVAIAVSSSTGSNLGKAIITGNQVVGAQGMGIYCNIENGLIANNRVENWGLRNSGDVGIHYSSGATVVGNRFSHSTLTGLACLRTFFQASYLYAFRDNVSESGNPVFSGPATMESSGAGTIGSGTTSVAITHGLVRTPAADEIAVTPSNNPTNDPGNLWVSAIGATQFTVNCRADPGAGGLTFRWHAAIAQPFTA